MTDTRKPFSFFLVVIPCLAMFLGADNRAQGQTVSSSDSISRDKHPQPTITVVIKTGALAEQVDEVLRDATEKGFSGAIIADEHGKVILKAGYGFANREQRVPFTTHTIAEIASLTKQFTAMALLDLRRQHKVDFSKAVKTYLPQIAEPVASVTLEQLLTHSSGMPLYCGGDFERQSKASLLSKCAGNSLGFPPGTQTKYSNPAFSILAAVVEEISGQPIQTYLREHFLKPLGMNDTGSTFPGKPRSRFAVGYLNGKPQEVTDEELTRLQGDYWNLKGNGDMQSSPDDMYRWYAALSRPGSIPDEMRQAAIEPRIYDRARDSWIAYDWNIKRASDGQTVQVSHSGSDDAFLAYFCWLRREKRFFYFVSNSGAERAVPIVKHVLDIMQETESQPVR